MIYTRDDYSSTYPSPIYRAKRYEYNDDEIINFIYSMSNGKKIKRCTDAHGFILLDGDAVFTYGRNNFQVLRKGGYAVCVAYSWLHKAYPEYQIYGWEFMSKEDFGKLFIAHNSNEWNHIVDSWEDIIKEKIVIEGPIQNINLFGKICKFFKT